MMAALAFLYGICGLAFACWLVYCLSDPTSDVPSNSDAAVVCAAFFFWPLCLLIGFVGLAMDYVHERRREAYYGGAK